MERIGFWLAILICPLIMTLGMYHLGYMLGGGDTSGAGIATVIVGLIAGALFFITLNKASWQ